jgi:hypothetical protein
LCFYFVYHLFFLSQAMFGRLRMRLELVLATVQRIFHAGLLGPIRRLPNNSNSNSSSSSSSNGRGSGGGGSGGGGGAVWSSEVRGMSIADCVKKRKEESGSSGCNEATLGARLFV